MKRFSFSIFVIVVTTFILSMCGVALAHFQVIKPQDNIVEQKEDATIEIKLLFTHPFEQKPMNMKKPKEFGVVVRGQKTDLLNTLKSYEAAPKATAWKTLYSIKRPGDHIFYVSPAPYWEEAEEKYIIHYTKTVVNAFGMEDAWDKPVGLRAEVIPLTRPYGLWAGNVFQGKVIVDGKPAAGADVEVEYYNTDSKVKAPKEPYITQVIKTDERGVFTYAIPWAGWWGFAALTDAPETMKSPSGQDAPIEIGALIWVYAEKAEM
ncbi:MAG: nickel transport protein [Thermovirga sp.]|jgi:cobalt/nickel transport protein|nr:nickel transport protein [Thermovirga sp.]